ncbi:MAG: peptidoglycan editing factor PgeF [Gammaproteobacteria bacterium]|nr:peptidoglycan editing factor PgeF [Gammaproteobacteria bacterium]
MIETIQPNWQAPPAIHACCTTRRGGVSLAPYDAFNLGLHVGDHDADVVENRRLLCEELALPSEPCWIDQTHGVHAVTLEQDSNRDADAAITREPGKIAVVMTADCLPILVCNRAGSEVAAIHAGWRGLQAGVIEATITALHSPAEQLLAWIGPGISQPGFEVGDEVYGAFTDRVADAQSCFSANRAGHWLCDLAGLAESVLRTMGLSEVARAPYCSYTDADLFYSYRREAVTGRMASLIWIN